MKYTKIEKCNWNNLLLDLQIISLAWILTNSNQFFKDGFSWLGLAGFVSGLLFVFMILYLRNLKAEWRKE